MTAFHSLGVIVTDGFSIGTVVGISLTENGAYNVVDFGFGTSSARPITLMEIDKDAEPYVVHQLMIECQYMRMNICKDLL